MHEIWVIVRMEWNGMEYIMNPGTSVCKVTVKYFTLHYIRVVGPPLYHTRTELSNNTLYSVS